MVFAWSLLLLCLHDAESNLTRLLNNSCPPPDSGFTRLTFFSPFLIKHFLRQVYLFFCFFPPILFSYYFLYMLLSQASPVDFLPLIWNRMSVTRWPTVPCLCFYLGVPLPTGNPIWRENQSGSRLQHYIRALGGEGGQKGDFVKAL